MSHNQKCTKTLLMMAFIYGTANAADVLPVGGLDTTATGKISSTKLLKTGEIKASSQFDGASYVIGLNQFASEGSGLRSMGQEKLATSANRFSLFAGYGVTDWMDLHIGVRTSSEKMNSEMRRKFYLDGSPEGSVSSTGGGFSGAVASAKFQLFSWKDFRLASLAFYESGVGDSAWQSVTRSESDKLGLALLSSYSFKSIGQVLANIGYRSRKAEEVGQMYLGNETFLKLSGNYHITPRFGAFLTVDSRSIRIADEKNPNRDGWLQYKNNQELSMELGLTGYVYGNYRMTGFVGGSAQKKAASSSPERTFGLSLVVPILSSKTRTEMSLDTKRNHSQAELESEAAEANEPVDSKGEAVETSSNKAPADDKKSSHQVAGQEESAKQQGNETPVTPKNSATPKSSPVASEPKMTKTAPKPAAAAQKNEPQQLPASYPEMQVQSSPVDAGIEREGEFKAVPVDPNAKPAVDPLAAIELELKQIADDEAKAIEADRKMQEENRKIAAKQWASNQKKKASLDRSIQKVVDRKTKDLMISDKDASYKGLD